MKHLSLALVVIVAVNAALPIEPARAAPPEGLMTWGVAISLVPTWFDPAETAGIITPFMVLYALHDAMVKPMPGSLMTPSLAESWSVSSDGLLYEFVLRKGVKFHNGDTVTAEDVKFSFERYRGTADKILKEKVAAIEIPNPERVRFRLKRAWPDFMAFYSSATGAGWIVPKKYVEKVGDEGFKKAPIGAGPYKFVSFTPGVELVMEAFDQYWRKPPNVRRLVFRVIPDESTRLAALKRGDVDIAYGFRGELADDVRRTPGLKLKATPIPVTVWLYFADQWDVKSPWHDRRVRLAANHAIDRQAISQAQYLGLSKTASSIVPSTFDFYWQPPAYAYDPARSRRLLAEAGYPSGLDAGDYFCEFAFSTIGEAVVNDLQAVGIRVKLRPLERAAFFKGYADKRFKNLIQGVSGALGNAATRIEAFVTSGGTYAHGSYADIDGLFLEQATELDPRKREAILQRIQQLVYDKAAVAPIQEVTSLVGVGPRVEQSALGLISGYAFFSAPYEDVKLKPK